MSTLTAEEYPPQEAALAPPQPRSLGRVVMVFAGGNAFATGLRAVSMLLCTRLLDPSVLGLFNGINLILGYVPFAGAGVCEGLSRELPYCFGRRDPERAHSLAGAALGWVLLAASLTAAGLLGGSVWHALHVDFLRAAGWATVAVLAFCTIFGTGYLQVLYRTSHDFTLLSRVTVYQAALGLTLVLAVAAAGFYGLCLRAVGTLVLGTALLWHWRPVRVTAALRMGDIRHLVRVGMPILFAEQVNRLWFVLHYTLILQLMGTRALGLFFFPLVHQALAVLPYAVHHITYPRITEMYAREASVSRVMKYLVRPTCALTGAMVLVVAAAWAALPAATRILLPNYVEGVQAVRWGMLELIILSLLPIRNVFSVVRKQHYYVIAILIGAAVHVTALFALCGRGMRLETFPQAFVIGRVAYLVACYGLLLSLCLRERSSGRSCKHRPPDEARMQ